MCAMDRDHCPPASQSGSNVNYFHIFDSTATPVCVRSAHGNFVYSNLKFDEYIKGNEFSCEKWFGKLPIELQYNFVSSELSAFTDDNVAVTLKFFKDSTYEWHVLFEPYVFNGGMFVIWRFFKELIPIELTLNHDVKIFPFTKNAINPCLILEPGYMQVFSLYFSGFSHDFISSVLMVSTTTSKNRISKIYNKFGIYNRDSMLLYLHANKMYGRINEYALTLINKIVT